MKPEQSHANSSSSNLGSSQSSTVLSGKKRKKNFKKIISLCLFRPKNCADSTDFIFFRICKKILFLNFELIGLPRKKIVSFFGRFYKYLFLSLFPGEKSTFFKLNFHLNF